MNATIGYAYQCNPNIDPDYFEYVINFQINPEISIIGEKIILSAVRGDDMNKLNYQERKVALIFYVLKVR